MTDMKDLLAYLATGAPLSTDQARRAFEIMMSGDATAAQTGAFLMGLRVRGETVDEITGAATTMRAMATAIDAPPGTVDTCGTGGDGLGTYNVSTAAALVAAACGVPVAKHGNRAMSSKSGSADVLAALGINLDADMDLIRTALWEVGFGFLLAPRHHGAMRHVGPVRVELGTRTIFNLLGPLSNPAGAKRQLIGVFDKAWLVPMAEVLGRLGSERVWIVHGADGMDELTITGPSHVAEFNNGAVRTFDVTPADAGLSEAKLSDIKGGEVSENAAALNAVIDGAPGAYRDIVLLNAAAALVVADKVGDLKDGAAMAAKAIDSGAVRDTVTRLVAVTNRVDTAAQ